MPFYQLLLEAFGAITKGECQPKYIEIWGKGVTYQMLHAVGLLIIGVLLGKLPGSLLLSWSGWLMFIGIVFY